MKVLCVIAVALAVLCGVFGIVSAAFGILYFCDAGFTAVSLFCVALSAVVGGLFLYSYNNI